MANALAELLRTANEGGYTGFLEVLLTLILGVIPIAYIVSEKRQAERERQRKEVTYATQIQPEDSPACEVYIRLSNSGNAPIRRTDYDGPLPFGFEFGSSAKIKDAQVSEQHPNLGINATISSRNRVSLTPVLLNPGDMFVLRVNVENLEHVKPIIRVAGLEQIREEKSALEAPTTPQRQSFVGVVRSLVFQPRDFFAGLPRHGNFVRPLVFGLICVETSVILSGLLALLGLVEDQMGYGFVEGQGYGFVEALILDPIVDLFILAGLYHLFVRLFVGAGNSGFRATFWVTCYSSVTSLVGWIPYIMWVALIYSFYLQYVGIREVHNTTKSKAALTILAPFLLVFLLVILISFVSVVIEELGSI